MDEQKIYRAALAAWGADAQTLMVFEEMAELQKELCKAARGRDNREQIAEEIADVEIMLEQMKVLHRCAEAVAAYRESKLRRLAVRCSADVEPEKGNEPLTLAELSELKGKPVVVLPIREGKSGDKPEWCVVSELGGEVDIPGIEYTWYDFKDYGKSWIAYRDEPQEGRETP